MDSPLCSAASRKHHACTLDQRCCRRPCPAQPTAGLVNAPARLRVQPPPPPPAPPSPGCSTNVAAIKTVRAAADSTCEHKILVSSRPLCLLCLAPCQQQAPRPVPVVPLHALHVVCLLVPPSGGACPAGPIQAQRPPQHGTLVGEHNQRWDVLQTLHCMRPAAGAARSSPGHAPHRRLLGDRAHHCVPTLHIAGDKHARQQQQEACEPDHPDRQSPRVTQALGDHQPGALPGWAPGHQQRWRGRTSRRTYSSPLR
jgi:hypothetical protein